MKEKKDDDVIYDLETAEASALHAKSSALHAKSSVSHAEAAEGQGAQSGSENSEKSDRSDSSDKSEKSENSDSSDNICRAEIDRMVEEMGAETLLEIIRDNRNAAIRQIISEVEASRDESLPSGVSGAASCSSIFDLAALA